MVFMNNDFSHLLALLSSKICHDFASPIQALTTALSVLETDNSPEMRESAINLIRESTQSATAKIEFLRQAFGSPTSGSGEIPMGEIQKVSNKYFETLKPQLVWDSKLESAPKAFARVLMGILLIGIDSLPRGGEVIVKSQSNGELLEFSIRATGMRVMLKPEVRQALKGEKPEMGLDGRTIAPYLTFLTATQNRIEMAAREDETSLTILARARLNPI